jgi:hypothetical protein
MATMVARRILPRCSPDADAPAALLVASPGNASVWSLGIAAMAGGDFAALFGGSTAEEDVKPQRLSSGLPQSSALPSNTVGLCAENGGTAGMAPVRLL